MENKLGRFFRATGNLRFFLFLGVILMVMGVLMFIFSPDKYAETTGTVTKVEEYEDTDAEGDIETYYREYFTYKVDGKEYENSFEALSKAPAVGSTVKVFYDPADPESISNTKNSRLIGAIMFVVGLAAAGFGIFSGVKNLKKLKAMDEQIREANAGEKPVVVVPAKEQMTEYYVLFDGNTFKPGYIVEDRNRSVVFTGEMTKNAAVGPRLFTFTDHVMGRTTEHQVGHTVTQQFNNEFFSMSSYFKFDGQNIWDLLHDKGIRIETDMHSIFPRLRYTVSLYGKFFALIESSSKYVHEEDEAEHKIAIPTGRYFFRCWTNEDNMDLLFLTVFAISESEQAIVE